MTEEDIQDIRLVIKNCKDLINDSRVPLNELKDSLWDRLVFIEDILDEKI